MAETYFEKQEREAREYQAREKQAQEHQEKQKGFADDYAKRQEELKAALTPEKVQQNVESILVPAFQQIAQCHRIFQQATPEQQQQFTAQYVGQDNREAHGKNELSKGIEQIGDSDRKPWQQNVQAATLTNPVSVMSQRSFDERKEYELKDQQFSEAIEAENDPIRKEHLSLQRAVATEQHEMTVANAVSNISRYVGDRENDGKYAALASEHETKRDALEQRLREFEQAHGLSQEQSKGQHQQTRQPTTEKESTVSETKNLSDAQKTLAEIQNEAGERNSAPVSDKQREMARNCGARLQQAAEQERDRSRERNREQER